ncbi:hypothetical protein M1583_01355 [Candidatus Marsarchaeota archaeon]|nr:hypothetical protein [Candidatus Marsarchaeota archaeon]
MDAGGNTGDSIGGEANATLSGYSTYFCAGGAGNGGMGFSWSSVTESNSNYADVGSTTSGVCTDTTGSPDLAVAILGVKNGPGYTTTSASTGGDSSSFSMSYGVSSSPSAVVIMVGCGWFECSGVSLPSGCTQLEYTHGNDSYETGYAAVCNQNAGSYTVSATSSSSGGISIAAFVYADSQISASATECTVQAYGDSSNNYGYCYWPGGTMTISSGGGNSGWGSIYVDGPDSYSTANTNWCPGVDTSQSMAAGWYHLHIGTGGGGGSCGPGIVEIN